MYKRLLHYGLRFYGADLLGVLSSYLDQIIIVRVLSPAEVGTYVVASNLARLLNVLQTSAWTVVFPGIAARSLGTVLEKVGTAVRVVGSVNVIAAIGLGLLSSPLLQLFYGSQFGQPARRLILLAGTVASNAANLLHETFAGIGRPGIITAIEGFGFAVLFGAMLLLVPPYGAIGAALAVALTSLMRFGCVLAGLRLILGVAIPQLIISRADFNLIMGR